ncbi:MAG: fatty acid desaturase [Pseudomonadota bacterium]
MDHHAVISGLDPDLKRALQIRSNKAGLVQLALHLCLIGFLAMCVAQGGVLRLFAILPLGICLIFLFTLEHEATHKTPFASERLNEWMGHLCGLLILLPFTWFRYFHLAHHKYTNDPTRDPELLVGSKPETRWEYVKHISGIPVWIGQIRKIWDNALGRKLGRYTPDKAKPRIIWEARIYLGFYALALTSLTVSDLVIWLWVVPLILGQPFLRLYLLAEHGRCAFVSNMLENTRTTYTSRLVRFLAWNMPFHTAHHILPNVPFHNLPKLNEVIADKLGATSNGYQEFHKDYIAQFQR